MTAMRLLQQEFATGEMGFTMSICAAAIRQAECLKGVKSAVLTGWQSLPLHPQQRTSAKCASESVRCRYCCKSRFAEGVKNSEGRRRGFRVEI
jgi:hypothetical protein